MRNRLEEFYVCDKCHGETDPTFEDNGTYEEVHGRKLWMECWERESGCCRGEDVSTIQEIVDAGGPIPEWAMELIKEFKRPLYDELIEAASYE